MTFALIAVCIGLVVLGAGQVVVRRVVDERRSVRDYQQTLQTLGTISRQGVRVVPDHEPLKAGGTAVLADPVRPRHPGWSVGTVSTVPVASGPTGAGPVRSRYQPADRPTAEATEEPDGRRTQRPGAGSARPGDHLADRRRDRSVEPEGEATRPVLLVFDDLAPPRSPATSQRGSALDSVVPVMAPAAMGSSDAEPKPGRRVPAGVRQLAQRGSGVEPAKWLRAATGIAAVLLVGAVVATVVVASEAGSGTHRVVAASRLPAASSSAGHRATTGQKRRHRTRGQAVSPAGSTVVPTAVTLYNATVPVSSTSYTVVVSVTAPCWIEAQQTTTGTDIWSGVLTGGTQHTFSLTGSVLLRIGAADATVTMNGAPVALPSGYQVPYNLAFTPS